MSSKDAVLSLSRFSTHRERALVVRGGDGPPGRAVEAAPPQLRLAVGAQVDVAPVAAEQIGDLETRVDRLSE